MLVLENDNHSFAHSTPIFSDLYMDTGLDPQARHLNYIFGIPHIAPKIIGKQTFKEIVIRLGNN